MKLIIDIPDDWKEIYDKGQDMKLAHFIGFKITEGIPLDEVLDKIRAEIDEQIKYNTYFNSDMAKGEIIAFEWVKRKIDEYTKGEGE